jgi:general secretion pathway protein M
MAFAFIDRLGLNPRERRLAVILLSVVAVIVVLVIPIGLETVVHAREGDNDELRTTLAAVQGARAQVRDRQARRDSIQLRYGKRAPPLAGYLEQTARTLRLEVTDSVDRPDVPHGKRYVERSTVIHLKKSGMYAIAKFLESLERSGMALAVTRLEIHKRTGEPDSYDVEVGVSAFDRNEQAPSGDADKDKKP